jgi:hypothetical protein
MSAETSKEFIKAQASSAATAAGLGFPEAQPTPAGDDSNTSTTVKGRMGGLTVDPKSPRTGLGVKAGQVSPGAHKTTGVLSVPNVELMQRGPVAQNVATESRRRTRTK